MGDNERAEPKVHDILYFLKLPKFQIFFLTDLIKYNAMLSIGVIIACLGSLGAALPSEDTFVSTNTKQGQ